MTTSLPNPLRPLGAARVVAGAWIAASGVVTLMQYKDLLTQAQRLFGGDPGSTDVPIRSLLTLITSALSVLIGVAIMVKGVDWLRRLAVAPAGPAAIDRDEVVALLTRRKLHAFGAGPSQPYWPLRRWLADQLDDMPWWRRAVMSNAVRAFVRSCQLLLLIAIVCIGLPYVTDKIAVGPFPATFTVVLLAITGLWAALSLLLIVSHGPRIETFEFPVADHPLGAPARPGTIVESDPVMLQQAPAAIPLIIGVIGIAAQCLIIPWWNLSTIGYPLMSTSIIRHSVSILGGIFFVILGNSITLSAAKLLMSFRYQSTLLFINDADPPRTGYAAGVRSESLGINGPRHLVASVAGVDVQEEVRGMHLNT